MIRHFGNHFGRFDVQDPIKAAAMAGTLGGVKFSSEDVEYEQEKTKVAELQTQAYAINYALTLKKIEKKMRKLKRDLAKSKKQGGMAVQIAETNAETILAMINRWNS